MSHSYVPSRPSESNNDKSFADLRLKLGNKKNPNEFDADSNNPMDLSDDEWIEIVKYQKEQYEDDKRKEKEEFERKK